MECKVDWVPVPVAIYAEVGLGKACQSVHTFKEFFEPRGIAPESEAEAGELSDHIPNKNGYQHMLPDGVVVGVRMSFVKGRYQAEWCLPDRRLDIPDDKAISLKFPALVNTCAVAPHRVIRLSSAARGAFLGYQTMHKFKVKRARDANDADSGAEYGIAPWNLGQLSACLLMWDIVWGKKKSYRTRRLRGR